MVFSLMVFHRNRLIHALPRCPRSLLKITQINLRILGPIKLPTQINPFKWAVVPGNSTAKVDLRGSRFTRDRRDTPGVPRGSPMFHMKRTPSARVTAHYQKSGPWLAKDLTDNSHTSAWHDTPSTDAAGAWLAKHPSIHIIVFAHLNNKSGH